MHFEPVHLASVEGFIAWCRVTVFSEGTKKQGDSRKVDFYIQKSAIGYLLNCYKLELGDVVYNSWLHNLDVDQILSHTFGYIIHYMESANCLIPPLQLRIQVGWKEQCGLTILILDDVN